MWGVLAFFFRFSTCLLLVPVLILLCSFTICIQSTGEERTRERASERENRPSQKSISLFNTVSNKNVIVNRKFSNENCLLYWSLCVCVRLTLSLSLACILPIDWLWMTASHSHAYIRVCIHMILFCIFIFHHPKNEFRIGDENIPVLLQTTSQIWAIQAEIHWIYHRQQVAKFCHFISLWTLIDVCHFTKSFFYDFSIHLKQTKEWFIKRTLSPYSVG